jgi:hypothetical protein
MDATVQYQLDLFHIYEKLLIQMIGTMWFVYLIPRLCRRLPLIFHLTMDTLVLS